MTHRLRLGERLVLTEYAAGAGGAAPAAVSIVCAAAQYTVLSPAAGGLRLLPRRKRRERHALLVFRRLRVLGFGWRGGFCFVSFFRTSSTHCLQSRTARGYQSTARLMSALPKAQLTLPRGHFLDSVAVSFDQRRRVLRSLRDLRQRRLRHGWDCRHCLRERRFGRNRRRPRTELVAAAAGRIRVRVRLGFLGDEVDRDTGGALQCRLCELVGTEVTAGRLSVTVLQATRGENVLGKLLLRLRVILRVTRR